VPHRLERLNFTIKLSGNPERIKSCSLSTPTPDSKLDLKGISHRPTLTLGDAGVIKDVKGLSNECGGILRHPHQDDNSATFWCSSEGMHVGVAVAELVCWTTDERALCHPALRSYFESGGRDSTHHLSSPHKLDGDDRLYILSGFDPTGFEVPFPPRSEVVVRICSYVALPVPLRPAVDYTLRSECLHLYLAGDIPGLAVFMNQTNHAGTVCLKLLPQKICRSTIPPG